MSNSIFDPYTKTQIPNRKWWPKREEKKQHRTHTHKKKILESLTTEIPNEHKENDISMSLMEVLIERSLNGNWAAERRGQYAVRISDKLAWRRHTWNRANTMYIHNIEFSRSSFSLSLSFSCYFSVFAFLSLSLHFFPRLTFLPLLFGSFFLRGEHLRVHANIWFA